MDENPLENEPLEKEASRRFAKSYRRVVNLGGNKACSLKRHFDGVVHEVVGYLDYLATLHPETRFAYASVDVIVAHCQKFTSKEKFSKAAVEKALKYLQMRHIISRRVTRWCAGQMRDGFIVAPHEHLTIRPSATKCRFVGMAAPFDCWEQDPQTNEVFWRMPPKSTVESTDGN
jgi:hypothetical protein